MKLLSFGEIIWDVYPREKTLGGAPLNLAAHAALQGSDAAILSAVGQDALGEEALLEINALKINTAYVSVVEGAPSGTCVVTLDEHHIPSYHITEHTAYDEIAFPSLRERYDVLAFGTLALRYEKNLRVLNRLINGYHFSEIYADLNIRKPFVSSQSVSFCLERATIVKISDEEMPTVLEAIGEAANSPEEAVVRLSSRYPAIKLFVITRGENGAFCYDAEKKSYEYVPAYPATVVSTVGAGDSFGATFLCAYLSGESVKAALEKAARVSAYVVSAEGAIPVGMREFLKSI